jgi:hypothetical protein
VGDVKVPVRFLINGKLVFSVYRICKDKKISMGKYIENALLRCIPRDLKKKLIANTK